MQHKKYCRSSIFLKKNMNFKETNKLFLVRYDHNILKKHFLQHWKFVMALAMPVQLRTFGVVATKDFCCIHFLKHLNKRNKTIQV